jgi:hypothetical protein
MNVDEAIAVVMRQWGHSAERRLGGKVCADESLTEEFHRGWVVHLVPTDIAAKSTTTKLARYAVDRLSGQSTPVGTKGIQEAVRDLFGK